MKVKILVEFEVKHEEEDEITENQAKDAATLAAWHHLVFTGNGLNVTKQVAVFVDGFGECSVKLGEEHE